MCKDRGSKEAREEEKGGGAISIERMEKLILLSSGKHPCAYLIFTSESYPISSL